MTQGSLVLVPRHTWTGRDNKKSYEMIEMIWRRDDTPDFPSAIVHVDTLVEIPELYKQLVAGKACRVLHVTYEIVNWPEDLA